VQVEAKAGRTAPRMGNPIYPAYGR